MNYVTIITPNNHLLGSPKHILIPISKSGIFATKFMKYLNHTSLATQMSIQISITKGTCTISFPWGHDDSHHLICNLVALVVFIWTNPSTVGIRAWHGVDHLVVINQLALFRVDIQLFKTFRVMNSAIKKISWKNKVVSIFADVFKNFRYIFYHYSPHLVRKFMQLRKWFCQQKMTGRKISPSWHFAAAAYGNLRRRSIPPQTKLHLGFMRDFPAKKTLEW